VDYWPQLQSDILLNIFMLCWVLVISIDIADGDFRTSPL